MEPAAEPSRAPLRDRATQIAKLGDLAAEARLRRVSMRASYAAGHPQVSWRDGYRVIRKAGRYMIFPRGAFSEWMGWHGARDGLVEIWNCLLYTSPSPRDGLLSRMPSSA